MPDARLPLDDIRVIDLTVARAGPTCVRQLADWGADVIRVEPPAGQPAPGPTADSRHGCDFQHLHRNKRSLSLNLKAPGARDVLMRLVDTADVLIENMRPPVKDRLGFDFGTVHARNPRLVYGSISGFGQDGPYAGRGGVDQIAQGMGGLMSVTGLAGQPADAGRDPRVRPGRRPVPRRRRAGRAARPGADRDRALGADLAAGVDDRDDGLPGRPLDHRPRGPAARPATTTRRRVPMGCFASADGYVNVAGRGRAAAATPCARSIGLPGLPDDPRFDSAAKRSANRAELNELIAERLRTRTTADWVEALNEAGVPCGPVYRMDEVFADPQVAAPGDDRAGGAPRARPARHPPQRRADDRRAGHRPGAEPRPRRPHRRGARRPGLLRRARSTGSAPQGVIRRGPA